MNKRKKLILARRHNWSTSKRSKAYLDDYYNLKIAKICGFVFKYVEILQVLRTLRC